MRKNRVLNVLSFCIFAAIALVTTSCSKDDYEDVWEEQQHTRHTEQVGDMKVTARQWSRIFNRQRVRENQQYRLT